MSVSLSKPAQFKEFDLDEARERFVRWVNEVLDNRRSEITVQSLLDMGWVLDLQPAIVFHGIRDLAKDVESYDKPAAQLSPELSPKGERDQIETA